MHFLIVKTKLKLKLKYKNYYKFQIEKYSPKNYTTASRKW